MSDVVPMKRLTEVVDVRDVNQKVVVKVAGYLDAATNEYLVLADARDSAHLDQMQVRQAAYDLRIPMGLHGGGIEPRTGVYPVEADDVVPSLFDVPTGKDVTVRRVFRINKGI